MNIGEVHAMEKAKSLFSQLKEKRTVHATYCEDKFKIIEEKSSEIGMVINAAKTQLLCVSDTRFSETESYFIAGDQKIRSQDEMKILGFVFEKRPSVSAHIKYCVSKFNKAIWTLSNRKRAKIDTHTLLKTYEVMLRPLLENCSPIYGPMLTVELSERLERQQKTAMKIIFGFDKHYKDILENNGLQTLASRRDTAVNNFTESLLKSERFNILFPLSEYPEDMVELRNTKKYKEFQARSNRLYNSPLYTMRRIANELLDL